MSSVFDTRKPISRVEYCVRTVLLWVVATACFWLDNHFLAAHDDLIPLAIFVALIVWVVTSGYMMMLSLRRLSDMRWPTMYALFVPLPGFNLAIWFALSTIQGRGGVQGV